MEEEIHRYKEILLAKQKVGIYENRNNQLNRKRVFGNFL